MSEHYRFDKDGKSLSPEGAVDTLLTQQQQEQSILRDQGLISRMKSMEVDNQEMRAAIQKMQIKLDKLEEILVGAKPAVAQAIFRQVEKNDDEEEDEDDEDDEIDLFGEDAADAKKPEAAERKLISKKPEIVAKSTILLDVKPWDDETDMVEVERFVRSVTADGLLWGASRLVEVGFGIKKLQINCVVEDDKVGTDMLEEEITKFKDLVQSVDVASFNKI